jgi:uridine kinase
MVESEGLVVSDKPFVISISGISGSGKTTIVTALKERLANTSVIYWDDYGNEVDTTRDINKWAADGFDCNEWNTKPVAVDIERLLKAPLDYILIDYPFGYLNECVGKFIDLTVFIDMPLDVALARRIIRDYTSRSQESDFGLADIEELSLAGLDGELRWYLSNSRPTYTKMPEMHKPVSDLVVDGTKSPEKLVNEIIAAIDASGGTAT